MNCIKTGVCGFVVFGGLTVWATEASGQEFQASPKASATSVVSYVKGQESELVAWKEQGDDPVVKVSVLNPTSRSIKVVMISSHFSLDITVIDENGKRLAPLRQVDPPSIPSNAVLTLAPYAAHWSQIRIAGLEDRYGQSMKGCSLVVEYGVSADTLAELKDLGVSGIIEDRLSVAVPL